MIEIKIKINGNSADHMLHYNPETTQNEMNAAIVELEMLKNVLLSKYMGSQINIEDKKE